MRELDHIWISTVWMQQLGLSQHSETMLANIVDGSVLDSLSRKDMDKHLGITRKFHQVSIANCPCARCMSTEAILFKKVSKEGVMEGGKLSRKEACNHDS